ncbi:23226_t:CDS:2 [Entrophospora sp. SA101]|nr:15015_t:CDS:2 [Entrophospora sp. SA101]CAJ0634741.1 11307_t:CDS:2 [Entrophospora sp. SA101]CAJ0757560.1 23226_t:CDS:2 [Entrophospora sp. SA101]CAJ0829408.1 7309_t:CDS:2 [Entrophospora sp. SA101]
MDLKFPELSIFHEIMSFKLPCTILGFNMLSNSLLYLIQLRSLVNQNQIVMKNILNNQEERQITPPISLIRW